MSSLLVAMVSLTTAFHHTGKLLQFIAEMSLLFTSSAAGRGEMHCGMCPMRTTLPGNGTPACLHMKTLAAINHDSFIMINNDSPLGEDTTTARILLLNHLSSPSSLTSSMEVINKQVTKH